MCNNLDIDSSELNTYNIVDSEIVDDTLYINVTKASIKPIDFIAIDIVVTKEEKLDKSS